jgi:hypothetical protein
MQAGWWWKRVLSALMFPDLTLVAASNVGSDLSHTSHLVHSLTDLFRILVSKKNQWKQSPRFRVSSNCVFLQSILTVWKTARVLEGQHGGHPTNRRGVRGRQTREPDSNNQSSEDTP